MDDLRECYRLLEVEPGATLEDVKRSYRELVKVWHPDRFSHDPKLREKAVEKLERINLAYERVCAAGETLNDGTKSTDEDWTDRREHRRQSEQGYTYTRREPPPEQAPPEPPPALRDVWRKRLAPAAATAGVLSIVALSVYFYPEPEPRLLIEIPPAEAPPDVERPRNGGTSSGPRVIRPEKQPIVEPPAMNLLPQKFFGKGSTKHEVIAAQGRPDSATETLFRYGTSDVHFEGGKVTSWRNGFPRLKIRMVAVPNLGGRTFFTVGSTKDQVIDAQGTPDSFTETSYTYGSSKVYFEGDRVTSWRIREPRLNARMLPKSGESAAYFSVGSSKDEVLAAQGTPDAFTESEFDYGTSRVYFDKGRVVSWDSRHPTLRVKPSG